jgi:hypothetical protein
VWVCSSGALNSTTALSYGHAMRNAESVALLPNEFAGGNPIDEISVPVFFGNCLGDRLQVSVDFTQLIFQETQSALV